MCKGYKVLVVDDEPGVLKALCIMLCEAGYETLEASDGLEALAVFAAQGPDVVILDVMMPGLDGLGTSQRCACGAHP